MQGDATMQQITPCLWCNDQAEAAARFSTSLFTNAAIGAITHDGEGRPRPKGSVLTVRFQLYGQEFLALNGGLQCTFTEAVSFIVHCGTQEELDRMSPLSSNGTENRVKPFYRAATIRAPGIFPSLVYTPHDVFP